MEPPAIGRAMPAMVDTAGERAMALAAAGPGRNRVVVEWDGLPAEMPADPASLEQVTS